MKKIEDYLPGYLGCEVRTNDHDLGEKKIYGRVGRLIGYSSYPVPECTLAFRAGEHGHVAPMFLKPLLRPLSDMTGEEAQELGKRLLLVNGENCRAYKTEEGLWRVQFGNVSGDFWLIDGSIFNQHQTIYLLKQRFDLFNLIPEGLAVDKNTLTTQTL
jgi:hypothetical protein